MLTTPHPPIAQALATRSWRPIHYLGSKLRITEQIRELLRQIDPSSRPVCDLFAGSGTVAAALASSRDVIAADIQEYSRVLCSAVLNPAKIIPAEVQDIVAAVTNSRFYQDLIWSFHPLIAEEQRRIKLAQHGKLAGICALLENSPIELYDDGDRDLKVAIRESRRRLKATRNESGPQTVTARHFGGVYFSYQQAVQLCALLSHANTQSVDRKDVVFAAVMSTASEIVNTVGKQFAQPLQIRDAEGKAKPHLIAKIARDRQLNVFEIFSQWLEQYGSVPRTDRAHKALCSGFSTTLDQHCADVGVIYADPPYTRDHYSRYYHVLETMCLGDEPEISQGKTEGQLRPSRGVYRVGRHQSPFCIKSEAPKAFERMFTRIRELEVPLVLSYSPLPNSSKPRPRVMTIEDISVLAFRFFKSVEHVSVEQMSHNKLNTARFNSETSANAEIFLICT